jgi:hypothetical protein
MSIAFLCCGVVLTIGGALFSAASAIEGRPLPLLVSILPGLTAMICAAVLAWRY